MSFIPTIAHALADRATSLSNACVSQVKREIKASKIRETLDEMIFDNNILFATDLVDDLLLSQIKCDVSDVFYQSFASGKPDMIKIFERYQTLSDENIRHGLRLALIRGQLQTAQYALQKAQQHWTDPTSADLKADKLITSVIDSHMFVSADVHKVVQWLLPWTSDDLSFAVVRASMHRYKKTARLLLKHSAPPLVLEHMGDNHADPKMQWLMDLINKDQNAKIKKTLPRTIPANKRKI